MWPCNPWVCGFPWGVAEGEKHKQVGLQGTYSFFMGNYPAAMEFKKSVEYVTI